jgi:hypothetical protein
LVNNNLGDGNLKLISDIRYFESTKENSDGYFPSYIGNLFQIDYKIFSIINTRFVLKLREKDFFLPDFDHIYVNFTTCLEEGKFELTKRLPDKYHPFYRFIDFGLSPHYFNKLSVREKNVILITSVANIISSLYCKDDNERNVVRNCVDEILESDENTKIIYKCKKNENFCVQIAVSILDNGLYSPNIRIYDNNQKLINEYIYNIPLRQDEFIYQFGSISIGKKSITIKPKNNSFSLLYQFKTIKYFI